MAHPDKDDSDNNAEVPSGSEVDKDEKETAKEELTQAIRGSHEIVDTATTVFPFTLFPDTITIDRAKVTITYRTFFQSARIISVRVEDILNVTADVGPFFGSLKIVSRVLSPDKPHIISFLFREDAMRIKRILQGYVIAMQKQIDVTPLETKELKDMLNKLGLDQA